MLKKLIQKYQAWRCDRNLQALYKDLQVEQFAGIARTFGSLQTRNGGQEIDTKCCSESQACRTHPAAHEKNKACKPRP